MFLEHYQVIIKLTAVKKKVYEKEHLFLIVLMIIVSTAVEVNTQVAVLVSARTQTEKLGRKSSYKLH